MDQLLVRLYSLLIWTGNSNHSSLLLSAGEDYQDVLATVYFRPDDTPSALVRISIIDDSLSEGEERFTLQLKCFDVSIVLTNSVAEILIEDDDGTYQQLFF